MHILLVEPNFKYVIYPPLGLLKLATFYRDLGYTCVLVRGKEIYDGPPPDIICITSLFTYAWEPVVNAYNTYHVKFPNAVIKIGGIYASLMSSHVKDNCKDAEVIVGTSEELDMLLPAWDLVPEWESSILFTSRGCPNNCSFCAVKKIEPSMKVYNISLADFIYQGHKKLIIQDNNILSEKNHWNNIYSQLLDLNIKVDFNQGLDAEYIDFETACQISSLKISAVRLAYDDINDRPRLENAIHNLKLAGVRPKNIMVYTLFNFNDTPDSFLDRFKDLLEWGVVCYPMKFEPINNLQKNSFVSSKWSKEFLELVTQARRVLGWGGSFIPHDGLKRKIFLSRTFEEAFSIRDKQLSEKTEGAV